MGLEGVSTDSIGLVLSLYFVGMFVGALYSKTLIARAGHIRMFAGCVSFSAISILICSFSSDLMLWGGMRVIFGFCNACAFTAMESWLSDGSTKQTRGKILAVYNAMIWGGLFGGQFFMNVASPTETTLFVIAGILLCAAVIPVSLSRNPGPVIAKVTPTSLLTLYKLSPLGVVSCLISGFLFAALFNLLPIFAKGQNIDGFDLSIYMGGAIVGGFILQFPVGYLSDRFDRRVILLTLLLISSVAAFIIPMLSIENSFWFALSVTSLLGGIIACTYPLSISQVFDQLEQNQMVAAMGSLILVFSLGGAIGPYSTSLVMSYFGNNALFYFLMVLQLLLAGFVFYRMSTRDALPVDEQEDFVMQATVVTPSAQLDPRTKYVDQLDRGNDNFE
jgi:MFS family permease